MVETAQQDVLIVGDRSSGTRLILATLASRGIHGEVVHTASAARSRAQGRQWALVLADLEVLDDQAVGFVREFKSDRPEMPVVMVSAVHSVQAAVMAMRAGCEDFLVKPLTGRALDNLLDMLLPNRAVPVGSGDADQTGERFAIVGSDRRLLQMLGVAARVARTSMPVLVTGESGTGKELVSRYIHSRSCRAEGPYVCVNCAAMSESLLESELFGHERGAFTGAWRQRKGLFERAHGGTLLLDEISETGGRLQAELLRLLEQQDFERVGGTERLRVNVRVIATSNRDLDAEVRAGRFRSDLYFRIAGLHMVVPPLRRRLADVPMLAWHFVNRYAREVRRHITGIDGAMMDRLGAYDWPGNVRELSNVVRTALALGDGPELGLSESVALGRTDAGTCGRRTTLALRDVERHTILEALRRTNSNHAKAAGLLGITDRTLREKIRRYRRDGHLQGPGEDECLTATAS